MNPDELARVLAGRQRDILSLGEGHKCAAVLVPIVVRGGEPALVFTQRSTELRNHSGQISFPGGRTEDDDVDRAATAVREAEEEIGLDPACVRVLGLLDDVPTPTGYLITPVVAWLDPAPESYRPNPREVAEVFEVPLARFRDPAVLTILGEVERWGRKFKLLAYQIDAWRIWGATARMVHELLGYL